MDDRYHLVLEIDLLPGNQMNSRKHWRQRHKETQMWDQLIHLKTFGKKPPQPLRRAALNLTRFGSRYMDADGLVASFKHVVDALVTAGILTDDSWEVIGMPIYDQKIVARGKGRIRIEILEAP